MFRHLFAIFFIVLMSSQNIYSQFLDNSDGTVSDKSTCLMWQKNAPGHQMTWKEALVYCKKLTLAGQSDWRLPSVEELRSIVDYSKYKPAIDSQIFPNTMSAFYWSSTSNANYTGYAWGVHFNYGYGNGNAKSSSYYVRAVREGQCGSFGDLVIWPPSTTRETQLPPVLTIEKITFSEKVLDALEQATLSVTLKNIGPGDAHDVQAMISSDTTGIVIPHATTFPRISAKGGKHTLEIPVKAEMNLPDTRAEITIQIIEPHFKVNIKGKRLVFSTRAFKQPDLKLVRFAVEEQTTANANQQIDINEIINVKLAVQNLGKGEANHVSIKIDNQQKGVMFLGLVDEGGVFRRPAHFSKVSPGKYETIVFQFFINSELTDKTLKFNIQGAENYQKFGFHTLKTVAVNTSLKPEGHIQQVAFDNDSDKNEDIIIDDVPEFLVDIDQSIPKTRMKNPDAVALIIGNRDYKQTDKVQYAINDALSMKRYLIDVFGYSESQVFLLKNASKGDFETYLGTSDNFRGKVFTHVKPTDPPVSDVFIYYSGHGAVGTQSKKGFLVPVDIDPQYAELGGYSTETMYKNLAKLTAKSMTIILDACFSGAKRISPMKQQWQLEQISLDNGVLMTSSKGSQYSSWYTQKRHGLFTYFFLKGIHSQAADLNNDHHISLQELYWYVSDRANGVPFYSMKLNHVEQTPTISGKNLSRVLVSFD
ncbi:caspase [Candidatus Magnetomorum sp. HK-1]|nr:caspase [Candidatus Magnetomorum sp. HK-1]